jgi:hypothetical protein
MTISIVSPKKIVAATKKILERPTKAKVTPPKKPRFSVVVASAKHARVDGNPAPTEIPKKTQTSEFINMSLFGIVVSRIGASEPIAIHKASNARLELGKNFDPRIAEIAIEMNSMEKRSNISPEGILRLLIAPLKTERIKVFHVRLFTTTINAGMNSCQTIPFVKSPLMRILVDQTITRSSR